MKSLCCFTSSTTFRTINNIFGNYQPLSSLMILMNFIQLYEKNEPLAFLLLDMFVFPFNRSNHVLNIFCYVYIALKKVCTMHRDRHFMLITFSKSSEPVLRTISSEQKSDFLINLCPLHETNMGTTKREYLLEGHLRRTHTYKEPSKRWW